MSSNKSKTNKHFDLTAFIFNYIIDNDVMPIDRFICLSK